MPITFPEPEQPTPPKDAKPLTGEALDAARQDPTADEYYYWRITKHLRIAGGIADHDWIIGPHLAALRLRSPPSSDVHILVSAEIFQRERDKIKNAAQAAIWKHNTMVGAELKTKPADLMRPQIGQPSHNELMRWARKELGL